MPLPNTDHELLSKAFSVPTDEVRLDVAAVEQAVCDPDDLFAWIGRRNQWSAGTTYRYVVSILRMLKSTDLA